MHNFNHFWNRGYIALSSVLIISFVTLALTTSVALLSIGESQSSLALVKGENTFQFVEGCAEDAMIKSRVNNSYNGGTITRPEGTCSISISKAGNVWTLTATTTNTDYARTIQVVFTRNPTGITLTSWKEM